MNQAKTETCFKVENIEKYIDFPVWAYDEIDSTNSQARRILEGNQDIKEGLVVADFQSAGRGRSGHSFYSPHNTGIYMSYFFTPDTDLSRASFATTKAAVIARRVLAQSYGVDVKIKWINDLYLGEKKISGILAEAHITDINKGSVIVGIGINLSTEDFPDDIQNRAGSLANGSNMKSYPSREEIIGKIANGFALDMKNLYDISYLDEYRQNCNLIDKNITYVEGETNCTAHVIGISDEARLIVEFEDGSQKELNSGEVSLIRSV